MQQRSKTMPRRDSFFVISVCGEQIVNHGSSQTLTGARAIATRREHSGVVAPQIYHVRDLHDMIMSDGTVVKVPVPEAKPLARQQESRAEDHARWLEEARKWRERRKATKK